jgi:hypothetical protein
VGGEGAGSFAHWSRFADGFAAEAGITAKKMEQRRASDAKTPSIFRGALSRFESRDRLFIAIPLGKPFALEPGPDFYLCYVKRSSPK